MLLTIQINKPTLENVFLSSSSNRCWLLNVVFQTLKIQNIYSF